MKRLLALGAALALIPAAAAAQPAPAAPPASPPGPPAAFSGYSQPDITPGLCRQVSPQVQECIIPARTAGRYLIESSGTSSAPRANAKQQLTIYLFDGGLGRMCGQATNQTAWTGSRTIRLNCAATLVTDRPLTVRVTYADENATRDTRGPTLSIRRLNWDGILEMQAASPAQ